MLRGRLVEIHDDGRLGWRARNLVLVGWRGDDSQGGKLNPPVLLCVRGGVGVRLVAGGAGGCLDWNGWRRRSRLQEATTTWAQNRTRSVCVADHSNQSPQRPARAPVATRCVGRWPESGGVDGGQDQLEGRGLGRALAPHWIMATRDRSPDRWLSLEEASRPAKYPLPTLLAREPTIRSPRLCDERTRGERREESNPSRRLRNERTPKRHQGTDLTRPRTAFSSSSTNEQLQTIATASFPQPIASNGASLPIPNLLGGLGEKAIGRPRRHRPISKSSCSSRPIPLLSWPAALCFCAFAFTGGADFDRDRSIHPFGDWERHKKNEAGNINNGLKTSTRHQPRSQCTLVNRGIADDDRRTAGDVCTFCFFLGLG